MSSAALVWCGLAVSSCLAGLLKGATGFGGALVLAPCFVLLTGPREATSLIILIHALTSLQGVRGWRPHVQWPAVLALSLIAVACTAVFARVLDFADPNLAKRITGVIVIAMALLQVSGWRWRHHGGPGPILLAGAISGACTAASGTGGPPAVVYFSGAGDNKAFLRGNLLAYFLLLYTLSGGVLFVQQRVTAALLWKSLLLAPLFYTGSVSGERLFHRMGDRHFDRLVAAVLVLSGGAILFR